MLRKSEVVQELRKRISQLGASITPEMIQNVRHERKQEV